MKYVWLLLLLMMWSSYRVDAGTIAAKVDRTVLSADDEIQLVITISGKFSGEPQVPAIEGLEITRVGQSSRMSMTFGSMSSETDFMYAVRPEKVGEYTIPSVSLTIDGKTEKTIPINLHVKGDDAKTGRGAAGKGGIAVNRELSEKEIYVGQAVKLDTQITSPVEVMQIGGGMSEPKAAQRFRNEEKQVQMRRELVNGLELSVLRLLDVLVPSKAGNLDIPAAKYVLKVKAPPAQSHRQRGLPFFDDDDMGFFGLGNRVKEVRVSAPILSIKVRPLPALEVGQVFSGLVGSFVADIEVSDRNAKVGDSLTVTVRISGDGLIDGILDQLDIKFPPSFKVYPDKPESKLEIDDSFGNGLRAEKIFKYAVVPTEAGKFSIEDLAMLVFSPKLGIYASLSSSFGQLNISNDPNAAPVVAADRPAANAEVKMKTDTPKNIPIEELRSSYDAAQLQSQIQMERFFWLAILFLFLAPGVMLLVIVLWRGVFAAVVHWRVPRSGRQLILDKGRVLLRQLTDGTTTDVLLALKDMMSGFLDVQPHAASRAEFEHALQKAKLTPGQQQLLLECFDALERATFSGRENSLDILPSVRQSLEEVLQDLTKRVKK